MARGYMPDVRKHFLFKSDDNSTDTVGVTTKKHIGRVFLFCPSCREPTRMATNGTASKKNDRLQTYLICNQCDCTFQRDDRFNLTISRTILKKRPSENKCRTCNQSMRAHDVNCPMAPAPKKEVKEVKRQAARHRFLIIMLDMLVIPLTDSIGIPYENVLSFSGVRAECIHIIGDVLTRAYHYGRLNRNDVKPALTSKYGYMEVGVALRLNQIFPLRIHLHAHSASSPDKSVIDLLDTEVARAPPLIIKMDLLQVASMGATALISLIKEEEHSHVLQEELCRDPKVVHMKLLSSFFYCRNAHVRSQEDLTVHENGWYYLAVSTFSMKHRVFVMEPVAFHPGMHKVVCKVSVVKTLLEKLLQQDSFSYHC